MHEGSTGDKTPSWKRKGAVQPPADGGSSGARKGDGEGHEARAAVTTAVMDAAQCHHVLDEEVAGESTPSREVLEDEADCDKDHAGSANAAAVGAGCRGKGARWPECRGVHATVQHVVS